MAYAISLRNRYFIIRPYVPLTNGPRNPRHLKDHEARIKLQYCPTKAQRIGAWKPLPEICTRTEIAVPLLPGFFLCSLEVAMLAASATASPCLRDGLFVIVIASIGFETALIVPTSLSAELLEKR